MTGWIFFALAGECLAFALFISRGQMSAQGTRGTAGPREASRIPSVRMNHGTGRGMSSPVGAGRASTRGRHSFFVLDRENTVLTGGRRARFRRSLPRLSRYLGINHAIRRVL